MEEFKKNMLATITALRAYGYDSLNNELDQLEEVFESTIDREVDNPQ